MIRQHWFNAIAATVALAAASASTPADDRYEVIEVPIHSSNTSAIATGIGPDGTVVGYGDHFAGGYLAFKYNPDTGLVSGLWWKDNDGYSAAYDINSSGMAVGDSLGGVRPRAIRWDPDLYPHVVDVNARNARAINEEGFVFGTAYYGDDLRPYIWHPFSNTISILYHLGGGDAIALDGNNDNDVCGYGYGSDRLYCHAFLYRRSHDMIDLGMLPGGVQSFAVALNDAEQVACLSQDDIGFVQSFLYSGGSQTSLGVLPGFLETWAEDINNRAQIVGSCASGATRRAFLWENGSIVDLNDLIPPDSGWVLEEAVGINDRGDIAGNGFLNGQPRAFLLRRVSLGVTGTCPGTIAATVYGATAGSWVALEYSANDGWFTIPRGYACTGTLVDLGLPLLPGSPATKRADATGKVTFTGPVPASLCGVMRLQAIDIATCRTSNVAIFE